MRICVCCVCARVHAHTRRGRESDLAKKKKIIVFVYNTMDPVFYHALGYCLMLLVINGSVLQTLPCVCLSQV